MGNMSEAQDGGSLNNLRFRSIDQISASTLTRSVPLRSDDVNVVSLPFARRTRIGPRAFPLRLRSLSRASSAFTLHSQSLCSGDRNHIADCVNGPRVPFAMGK